MRTCLAPLLLLVATSAPARAQKWTVQYQDTTFTGELTAVQLNGVAFTDDRTGTIVGYLTTIMRTSP